MLNLTSNNIFFKYAPMHLAFCLIQLAREKFLDKNLINHKLFFDLVNLYGITPGDYIKCYEEIKSEINLEKEKHPKEKEGRNHNIKDEIAIITFKNRIAQRKYDDRVVWERIDKSTPLYNGDLIRTAELAEAVITFNDGSEVNIYENTMIQVYYSDFEGVNISVGNGNLQVESSEKGNVQLTMNDGSTVKAAAGTSLSAKTGAGGAGSKTVEVQSGSATVTGASGITEAMQAGQSLSVKSTGEIAKMPVTVTSIPPELRVLNVEGEPLPVKLEWNKTNSNQPVILQTSRKKDFSQIAEEKVLASANDSLINISQGTLYWRVFPQGNEDEATEGKISVEAAEPL
jgi:hypothetical protein